MITFRIILCVFDKWKKKKKTCPFQHQELQRASQHRVGEKVGESLSRVHRGVVFPSLPVGAEADKSLTTAESFDPGMNADSH